VAAVPICSAAHAVSLRIRSAHTCAPIVCCACLCSGTTSGEFVFAINVNLYPSASSSSESGDGTPPAELRALSERLFARFKATLVGTAPPPGAKL
jgi:hypothetical protein